MSVTSVVGLQWGDEGKGKVLDILCADADWVVRYQGGNNAGHTVHIGGTRHALHLVPSGILRPGTRCVVAHGTVVDPSALLAEVRALEAQGLDVRGRLFLSDRAHVILPCHVALDRLGEERAASDSIGTTGRGIGPCYADKASRIGVRLGDLYHPERLRERLARIVREKNVLLREFLGGVEEFDANRLADELLVQAEALRGMVTDTCALIHAAVDREERILVEGAQGTLLDLDLGTYPFVTSSNASACGIASGLGIPPGLLGECLGVMKAYTTRVGEGPFPTELAGEEGEALRRQGGEYGATTGRPRRCGWLDAVALRFALRVNGVRRVALTKLDVLRGFDPIRVCTAYRIQGREHTELPSNLAAVRDLEPVYEDFEGFSEDLDSVRSLEGLPARALRYIRALEARLGVTFFLVSVGSERDRTLFPDRP